MFTCNREEHRPLLDKSDEEVCNMSDKEQQVIDQIDSISKRGNSAEVKKDKDGNYIVYEVKRRRQRLDKEISGNG